MDMAWKHNSSLQQFILWDVTWCVIFQIIWWVASTFWAVQRQCYQQKFLELMDDTAEELRKLSRPAPSDAFKLQHDNSNMMYELLNDYFLYPKHDLDSTKAWATYSNTKHDRGHIDVLLIHLRNRTTPLYSIYILRWMTRHIILRIYQILNAGYFHKVICIVIAAQLFNILYDEQRDLQVEIVNIDPNNASSKLDNKSS